MTNYKKLSNDNINEIIDIMRNFFKQDTIEERGYKQILVTEDGHPELRVVKDKVPFHGALMYVPPKGDNPDDYGIHIFTKYEIAFHTLHPGDTIQYNDNTMIVKFDDYHLVFKHQEVSKDENLEIMRKYVLAYISTMFEDMYDTLTDTEMLEILKDIERLVSGPINTHDFVKSGVMDSEIYINNRSFNIKVCLSDIDDADNIEITLSVDGIPLTVSNIFGIVFMDMHNMNTAEERQTVEENQC